MRFSDEVIASYLNEEWRAPPAVHGLLGSRGAVADIAYALERLARAGKIEAKHEAAMTGRAGPPVLGIDYYRKLQKWPKSSSVGKLPTSPTVTVTKGRQQPARKKPASAAPAAPRTEYDRQTPKQKPAGREPAGSRKCAGAPVGLCSEGSISSSQGALRGHGRSGIAGNEPREGCVLIIGSTSPVPAPALNDPVGKRGRWLCCRGDQSNCA
jgi:hypothetical protein